jgi:hypothetical protein
MKMHKVRSFILLTLLVLFGSPAFAVADDHGNTCDTATTVNVNSTRAGTIETAGDYDYFRIPVPSAGTLTVYTTGSTDTYGFLKNASCTTLASNDDYGNLNFRLSSTVQAGTYYVAVRHYSSTGTGAYTLTVDFVASAPPADDHGNTCDAATTVNVNSTRAGTIETAGDYDYFRMPVPAAGTLTVYTTGSTDTYGFLKNASCTTLASNDDYNGDLNFRLSSTVQAGTYYVTVRHYSSTGTGAYTLTVGFVASAPPAVGWSDVTGYRHAETTTQRAIVAAALNGGDRSSPQSITGSPWLTDTSANDGARMRAAIQDVYNYWNGSGRPSLPLQSLPTAVQNTMRTHLTQEYPPSTYRGYTNINDQNAFIERIRVVFNGTVPTTDNGTLAYLGIRAQCKEFADRMVQAGGGIKRPYSSAAVARTNLRPGMYAFKNGQGHAAIIVAVYWDGSGQPTHLRLAESNWGTGWNNPTGQVPWSRTVRTSRDVPIADYYVVATE